MNIQRLILLMGVLFGQVVNGYSQGAAGRTVDENNAALPFVSIRDEAGIWQTTSGSDGTFFMQGKGVQTLLFRIIGYKPLRITLSTDTLTDVWEVKLIPQAIVLNPFEVQEKPEDLGRRVMEQAQAMRSFYKKQLETFSYRAYIRGSASVKELPQQILGRQIMLDGLDSTRSGTVYLSESLSEYYYGGRGKEKEIMLRSRVAGSSQGISWNSARDLQIDLYAPLIQNELTTRPLVSPLSADAFMYYRFRHLGASYEDTLLIHKIELIPKVKGGPAIQGVLEIQEGTWRVHSASLLLTKDQGIDVLDSLHADITFIPVQNTIWVKGTQLLRYSFQFPLFKLRGDGYFIGSFDEWRVPGMVPPDGFSSEVVQINNDVQERNPEAWDTLRTISLTSKEVEDYQRKDSLALLREKPEYLDSIDRVANRFRWPSLLFGYTLQKSSKGISIRFTGPVNGFHFNTVEGPVLSQGIQFRKFSREDRTYLQMGLQGRYGFNSGRAYLKGTLRNRYRALTNSFWEVSGGQYIQMAGVENGISEWVNDLYTMFFKENYPLFLAESNASFKWGSSVLPNLSLKISAGWKWREPLTNAQNLSAWFFPWDSKQFRDNSPVAYGFDGAEWQSMGLAHLQAEVNWSPKRKYQTRPNLRLYQNSTWPEFYFSIEHASGLPGDAYAHFTKAKLAATYTQNAGVTGDFVFASRAEYIIQAERLHFQDRIHYRGSNTLFMAPDFSLFSFQALPMYAYSAETWSFQGLIRWEMNGWLLWKLPYMERLRWRENFNFRALWNDALSGYIESGFGIEGIFRIFSFEAGYYKYTTTTWDGAYFRFAIGI